MVPLNMLQMLAGAVPEDAHILSHATHVDGSSSGKLSGVPEGSCMPRSNVRATNSHKMSECEALDEESGILHGLLGCRFSRQVKPAQSMRGAGH